MNLYLSDASWALQQPVIDSDYLKRRLYLCHHRGRVRGVLGEDVGSNTAANSWQGRCTVAEARVGNTIELRFADKESFFPSLSMCQRQIIEISPQQQQQQHRPNLQSTLMTRVSRCELCVEEAAETQTAGQHGKHMVLAMQQLLLSKT